MSSDGILVAIFQSAKSGYLEDLEAIFGGASPETALELANVRDISDFTPLHYAAGANHHQVVRLLALNKADINAVDRLAGDTPLHKVRASSLSLSSARFSHTHTHTHRPHRAAPNKLPRPSSRLAPTCSPRTTKAYARSISRAPMISKAFSCLRLVRLVFCHCAPLCHTTLLTKHARARSNTHTQTTTTATTTPMRRRTKTATTAAMLATTTTTMTRRALSVFPRKPQRVVLVSSVQYSPQPR